jgi:hypothetical protein
MDHVPHHPDPLAELEHDLKSIIDTVVPRHQRINPTITLLVLNEIPEEVVSDLGLASRWPAQTLLEILQNDLAKPAKNCAISAAEMANLSGLPRLIIERFNAKHS